ncbi:hypothetical protein EXIGLDRAFT_773645 [Exidia glandulosa HHB12029]|uniref:Uncharacterized protein n=1 Tax=Exidia glandulosa HHB12029 TaxID=1314781 RepID=A0A165EPV9_EXIGL|nr:hypothetical protein EXIGLDRAFT_773645 [Exidia glandulosa HHB12029]
MEMMDRASSNAWRRLLLGIISRRLTRKKKARVTRKIIVTDDWPTWNDYLPSTVCAGDYYQPLLALDLFTFYADDGLLGDDAILVGRWRRKRGHVLLAVHTGARVPKGPLAAQPVPSNAHLAHLATQSLASLQAARWHRQFFASIRLRSTAVSACVMRASVTSDAERVADLAALPDDPEVDYIVVDRDFANSWTSSEHAPQSSPVKSHPTRSDTHSIDFVDTFWHRVWALVTHFSFFMHDR